jgi:hypothetical protein
MSTQIQQAVNSFLPHTQLEAIRTRFMNRFNYKWDKETKAAVSTITAVMIRLDSILALFKKLGLSPYNVKSSYSGSLYFQLTDNKGFDTFSIRISNHRCHGWALDQVGDIRVDHKGNVIINSVVKHEIMQLINEHRSEA